MPHVIIEFSDTLEAKIQPQVLVDSTFQGCVASSLFEHGAIKTRAIAYNAFSVGGNKTDFIHVDIRILRGRTDEQKRHLTATVMKQLNGLNLSPVSITVEVSDIHSESYAKRLIE